MSEYIINVQTKDGTTRGTVEPDLGFRYSDDLNDVKMCLMTFSSLTSDDRTLLALGNVVDILRDGTREFFGEIDSVSNLDAGGVSIHVSGWEIRMARENGTYSNSPWQQQASENIFDDLIGDSTYVGLGTTANAFNTDFRASQSQSILQNINNLLNKTGQDFEIDYSSFSYAAHATDFGIDMNIVNQRGSSTSVATFNNKIDIKRLEVRTGYPLANKIRVYGKGDGENQFIGTDQDATSITNYGAITHTEVDRTVMSQDEADKLATQLLAIKKDPQKYYTFEVLNPDRDLEAGDVITINSEEHGLSDEEVRIMGIERGVNQKREFLALEVSSTTSNRRLRKRNKYMARLEQKAKESDTYKQGSGNTLTWAQKLNGKSGAPLVIAFNIPSSYVTDEAGDIRVSSFTLDYDIDPFRSNIGSTTESNTSPALTAGTATASHKHDAADSGHTHDIAASTSQNTTLRNTFVASKSKENDSTASPTFTYLVMRTPNVPGTSIDVASIDIQLTTENSTGSGTVSWEVYNNTVGATVFTGSTSVSGNAHIADSHPTSDSSINVGESDWLHLKITGLNPGANIERGSMTVVLQKNHSHSLNAITNGAQNANANVSDTNKTPNVSGAAVGHNHGVSIGDDVSDAGSVNSTQLSSIKVKYYENKAITNNETAGVGVVVDMADTGAIRIGDQVYFSGNVSGNAEWATVTAVSQNVSITCNLSTNKSAGDIITWVLKHTISSTGTTLDTDVDLSNGGTLPDAAGFWKVELDPNSASADLLQGIVKIKHSLDN